MADYPGYLPLADPCRVLGLSRGSVAKISRPVELPDLVVVPAVRPTAMLDHAAAVASIADCPLVVICSSKTSDVSRRQEARFNGLLTPRGAIEGLGGGRRPEWAVAATLDPNANLVRRFNPLTSRSSATRPFGDIAEKRNIAVRLAHLLGKSRLLFLDDDVGGLDQDKLYRMSAFMARQTSRGESLDAVGWTFEDFPDNSVVRHANRFVGFKQGTFIGAGALLVRCDDPTRWPFFPKIYNEDWLALLPSIYEGRVISAGRLWQAEYDPFDTPERALYQEFGDVLAEGLFRSLDSKCPDTSINFFDEGHPIWVTATDRVWWEQIIEGRQDLLFMIKRRLRTQQRGTERMKAALDRAQQRLALIAGGDLVSYVLDWREDVVRWRAEGSDIPPLEQTGGVRLMFERALEQLGLRGSEWSATAAPRHLDGPRRSAVEASSPSDCAVGVRKLVGLRG